MIKNLKQTATITSVERLNNSYVGNPRYSIGWLDEYGQIRYGKTQTNGVVGYKAGYWLERKTVTITYHYTNTGKLIIDDIEKTK